MGIADRLRTAVRAYVLGADLQGDPSIHWGRGNEDYQPPEYADYQATSNGVYACSTLRANLLASDDSPLRIYKGQGDDRKEVDSGSLYDLIHFVNPFWTLQRLLRMTELSLYFFGESFWFIERGTSGVGEPREIWWARPDKVKIVPHPEKYISHYLYTPSNGGEPIKFAPSEVVWMPQPNIADEFSGLGSLAAARLAADTASAAMLENRAMFSHALTAGGFIMPEKDKPDWTVIQRDGIADDLNRKFTGSGEGRRFGVFRQRMELVENTITPNDATSLGLLKWSLEDICRASGVPLDLVGGQRTYENVDAAQKFIWMMTIIPEQSFIAEEMGEKFAPMFPGQADAFEFDTTAVEVLQEGVSEAWERADGQLTRGAITINEWRASQGLTPVEWGETWWKQISLTPADIALDKAENPAPIPAAFTQEEEPEEEEDEEPKRTLRLMLGDLWLAGNTDPARRREMFEIITGSGRRLAAKRAIEYGGPMHRRLMRIFEKRSEPWDGKVAETVGMLFMRQRDSVLDKLKSRGQRAEAETLTNQVFKKAAWVKASREAMRPLVRGVVEQFGRDAFEDLALDVAFDIDGAAARRFIEKRAQRFATEITDTSWDRLRATLSASMGAGESNEEIAEAVDDLFTSWYRHTGDEEMIAKATRAFVIARTEVNGASNGGTLEAWRQSDVVDSKTWLSALVSTTRDSHITAHGQTVKLNENFIVGMGEGPAPGQIGVAGEDINCLCTMTAGIRY